MESVKLNSRTDASITDCVGVGFTRVPTAVARVPVRDPPAVLVDRAEVLVGSGEPSPLVIKMPGPDKLKATPPWVPRLTEANGSAD